MATKTNIALIGFMGAGKTTIGRNLAKKINFTFVDTDDEIESRAKMSISEIFELHGEEYFRKIESEALNSVLSRENIVIATGGGVVKNKKNIDKMKIVSTVFYIEATSETIYNNVKNSTHRPLLNCPNPLEKINELLNDRLELYKNSCDFIVNVDKTEVDQNVESIINIINMRGE